MSNDEIRIENLKVARGIERSRGDEYRDRYYEARKQLKALADMLFEYCPLERYAEATEEYEALNLEL